MESLPQAHEKAALSKYRSRPSLRWERLGHKRSFTSPELQASQEKNPLDSYREQYRVWFGEREAAFVTYDIFFEDQLNLYEMVVARHLRGKGIGSEIILFSAELARQKGKPLLSIRAGQIGEQTKGELRSFYLRRGLEFREEDPDLFLLEIEQPSIGSLLAQPNEEKV